MTRHPASPRRVRLASGAAALALGLALAGCADGTSTAGDAGDGAVLTPAVPAPSATPEGHGSASQLTGEELDRAFINGMVAHHQAAVEMAEVELAEGDRAEVKALAQEIIDAQRAEIETMTSIAQEEYSFTPEMGHSGPMGEMMGMPMTMDMSTMAEELAEASDVDEMFLMMMIPHHASAIVMADELLRNGSNAELKDLAETIIADQAREIGEMQELLESA